MHRIVNTEFKSYSARPIYCNSTLGGEENTQVRLPSKENFHLFLLAGQSNMAGRGIISAEDEKIHPRVFMLSKDGKWKPAVDPIHYDKTVAGVGLGKNGVRFRHVF